MDDERGSALGVVVSTRQHKSGALWIAYAEGLDPVPVALGVTEQDALNALQVVLEEWFEAEGEYIGTVHG